jgi:hypothetical protein
LVIPDGSRRNLMTGEAFSELSKSSSLMKRMYRLGAALGVARGRPA